MATIMKAHSSADFLAMLPQLVGTDVRQSVVLVGFRGNRTHGAIRFDLPPGSATLAVNKRFTTTAIGTLCKIPGIESIVVVISTPELFGEAGDAPSRELAELLAARIDRSGFGVREVLCLAADGWGSYDDRELPAGGHPLSEVRLSKVLDGVPNELRRDVVDRDAPTHYPEATAKARRALRRRMDQLAAALETVSDDDEPVLGADNALAPLSDIPQLVEDALGWEATELAQHTALLLLALQGPPIRDQTMLQWATNHSVGELLYDWAALGPVGSDFELDEVFGGLMMGVGARPDPARIHRGISVVLTLLTLADGRDRLAPLCMVTWMHWALGMGSLARRFLDEAIRIDHRYGMVEVLHSMLSSGMLPEWAFNSEPTD